MNGSGPDTAPSDLDQLRALVRRARRDAFHWAFRAVLLALIAGLALRYRWFVFGGGFAVLALMAVGLVRSLRRRAAALEAQVKLREAKP